ncbi:LANO_0A04324g1_1 [Lachancea nothofagi CBS 11611]|uniref:LANO_0A04324g1_1 n=1 Tax=Lachancea nothofagi CBS 11611 TaxID=1266666 RepID=A0A1G4IQU5_9SACH|nr:LANO_0A04324g1_1 [Lachancea nothofagi CBS 11611]
MDYQNRAGSKKGSGGVASASQENLHRRKQVEELLREGEEVPYSFHGVSKEAEELTKKNPYIYKNHAGRLVCKLCNTMHVSWSSVERHLEGKKHGLNLLRRGGSAGTREQEVITEEDAQFKQEVEKLRSQIKDNGQLPHYQVARIQDPATGYRGVAIKIMYGDKGASIDTEARPFVRIMSSLELSSEEGEDKKYVVVAYEPFKNVAFEIPNQELYIAEFNTSKEPSVDDFNGKCTYWDCDELILYVQFFFKE